MTVTVPNSDGPKLDPRTDVGVRIIKLPPRAEVAGMAGSNPSEKEIMAAASKIAGPAKKTDIVVFDHKPWHKVNGELHPHPQVHIDDPETILAVSFSRKDRPVWWSTEPFTITTVKPSPHHGSVATAPQNPFDGPSAPYVAGQEPGITSVWSVRAPQIVAQSIGHMYKITFFMDETIDPDMSCNP
jgi:hypothetical protein